MLDIFTPGVETDFQDESLYSEEQVLNKIKTFESLIKSIEESKIKQVFLSWERSLDTAISTLKHNKMCLLPETSATKNK